MQIIVRQNTNNVYLVCQTTTVITSTHLGHFTYQCIVQFANTRIFFPFRPDNHLFVFMVSCEFQFPLDILVMSDIAFLFVFFLSYPTYHGGSSSSSGGGGVREFMKSSLSIPVLVHISPLLRHTCHGKCFMEVTCCVFLEMIHHSSFPSQNRRHFKVKAEAEENANKSIDLPQTDDWRSSRMVKLGGRNWEGKNVLIISSSKPIIRRKEKQEKNERCSN